MISACLVDLGFSSVVGSTAHLPATAGCVDIDASSPHTMAECDFAAITTGGANNGSCQIAATVATKLN